MAPTSERGCGPWLSGRVANPFGLHDQTPPPGGVMFWLGQYPAAETLSRVNRFCRFGRQYGGPCGQHGPRSHGRPGGGTNAGMLINCLSAAAETAGRHNGGTQHRGENRPYAGGRRLRRDQHHPPAGCCERILPGRHIPYPHVQQSQRQATGRANGSTSSWRRGGGRREPVNRGTGARPVSASVPRRPGGLPAGGARQRPHPGPGLPA